MQLRYPLGLLFPIVDNSWLGRSLHHGHRGHKYRPTSALESSETKKAEIRALTNSVCTTMWLDKHSPLSWKISGILTSKIRT